MKLDYPVIEADVLVIGGGSAGAMAAIRAKEMDPNQNVVVFEKGDIKYSGCIARGMDALNIVAVPGLSTPELYIEANSMACDGIMDEPVNYRMAQRSWEMLRKLESWDVCFPTDEKGEYEVLQVHPKGRFCVTMKEPELKTILAQRVMQLGKCHQSHHGGAASQNRRTGDRCHRHECAHRRDHRLQGQIRYSVLGRHRAIRIAQQRLSVRRI